MPYISTQARLDIDGGQFPQTAGELNYKLTKLLQEHESVPSTYAQLLTDYALQGGLSYQRINDCIGAANGALMEARRRGYQMPVSMSALAVAVHRFYEDVAGPYEDSKITANGDVWE